MAEPRALGRTPLGIASAHGAGAFLSLPPAAGTPAQEDHRLARQMVMLLRRWLPHRPLVLVGDNGYAVLDLLHCCQSLREPVTLIARLRLDAALYAPAPTRQPGQNGRPALKGPRRPSLKTLLDQADVPWTLAAVAWYDGTTRTVELTSQTAVWYRSSKPAVTIRWVLVRDPEGPFDPQALLYTDLSADPTQMLEGFVLRWQLEVTFQEARTHLGMETQRQWSDLAIARTTPILLGLFSWTTLAAHALQQHHPITSVLPLGTTSRRRPSWTPSPWCIGTCGWRRRVFHCPRSAPICRNFPSPCPTEWWTPSLTPLELRKVQLGPLALIAWRPGSRAPPGSTRRCSRHEC